MKEDTSISVVVPLFNKSDFVIRTLASAFAQISLPNEIIVVDDGSTDGGADLVAATFPSVVLLRQPNGGEAAARNTGISHSRSEWVAFLDADDVWHPDHLSELRILMTEFPDSHLVATAYDFHPPRGGFRCESPSRPKRAYVDVIRKTQRNLGFFWTSAIAVRRSSFESAGGFALSGFGTDVDAWIRTGLIHPCAYSPRITATYMTGNPGVMQDQRIAADKAELDIPQIRKATDLPGMRHLYSEINAQSGRVTPTVLRQYQNARICQALKISVRNRHQRQAEILVGLLNFPFGFRSLMYMSLVKMPSKMREALLNLWLRIFRR